jgi:chorismate mutase
MEKERESIPEKKDELLQEIIRQNEQKKEQELLNLIVEILVSSTLREYYGAEYILSDTQPIEPEQQVNPPSEA